MGEDVIEYEEFIIERVENIVNRLYPDLSEDKKRQKIETIIMIQKEMAKNQKEPTKKTLK